MTRSTSWCGAAAGIVMLLAAPRPAAALHTLLQPGASTPTEPLVAAVTLAAWALVAWLLLTALLTAGSCLRGAPGAACAVVLRRAAPATVRRAVAVALGVGVVLGSAGAARADPAPSATSVAAPSTPAGAPGSLDWPGLPAVAAQAPTPAALPPSAGTVVVEPGDSLWRLAAAHLPARATNAAVAEAWPVWWSANRDVLGDHPDLLHPGERLVVPPAAPPGAG